MVGMASYRIAKNFSELPSAVQSLVKYRLKLTKAFKGIENARGARAKAVVLAARAEDLRSQISAKSVTVAVVRVHNIYTGEVKTLVAWNGETPVAKKWLRADEEQVKGFGLSKADGYHAEANIFEWLRRRNDKRLTNDHDGRWFVVEGGASRSVSDQRSPMMNSHGLKVEGNLFWRD